MPVVAKCATLLDGLATNIGRVLDSFWDTRPGTFIRQYTQRGVEFIARFGPAGRQFRDEIVDVASRAMSRKGRDLVAYRQFRGRLRKADRIAGAQISDRVEVPDASPAAREFGRQLRELMDRGLRAAQVLGVVRQGGMPIRGSGRAFPTMLNAEGREVVGLAVRHGASHGRVKALLERMVREGRYDTEDEALAALRQARSNDLRATNHYMERVRVDLPAELREWDPDVVLPRALEQNAMFLEGVREWGQDFEGARLSIARIGRESGDDQANMAQQFLTSHFGVLGEVPHWEASVWNAWSNWETVSKLSGLFSPILNFGQRVVNTVVNSRVSIVGRALWDLKGPAGNWFKGSRAIREQIDKTGVISGLNPLTELARQRGVSRKVAQVALSPFMTVARGNEYTSAWVARLSIDADIKSLMRLQGAEGRLAQYFEVIRTAALNPTRVVERRIGRRLDLSPQEVRQRLLGGQGEPLSPRELEFVMQKAVRDEQFALNILTHSLTWKNNPFFRLAFKFKTFGVRQTEFIWESVVREALLGNPLPAVKFMAAAAVMGEVYNLSKDLISGSDRSVTQLLANRDPERRDPEEIAARLMNNIAQQGGIGIFAEMHYGVTEYILGPAWSSIENALGVAQHINADPSQAELAIIEGLKDEIVPLRQAADLIRRAESRHNDQVGRFRAYSQLRSASFQYENLQEREEPGVRAALKAAIERSLRGPLKFEVTGRTLRYRYSARAISAGDVDEAANYLSEIFGEAEDSRELRDLVDGAEASMRSNAPMGNLTEDERRDFLSLLPRDRRLEARRLRRDWIRDYERAIRQARRNARRRR